jgi:SpoIID/LytB domain protein
MPLRYRIRNRLPYGFAGLIALLVVVALVLAVSGIGGGSREDLLRAAESLRPEPKSAAAGSDEGTGALAGATGDLEPNYAATDTEQSAAGTPQAQSSPVSPGITAAAQPSAGQQPSVAAAEPAATLSPGSAVPGPNAVFVFKAYGRAHGAGMCMDGVHYRALAGQDYHEILSYYYTGITFSTIDDGRPIRVKGRDGQVRTWSMRDYLYHLQEEPNDSPVEELKCLYVAARTYTLSCIARGKHTGSGYDVCSSGDCCQACDENKTTAAYPNNNAAVDATAGEIMTYDGAPIIAAYCGSCGGHTDNSEDVFGGQPLPYLRGKPDTYCSSSPRFCSVAEIAASDLGRRLNVGELKLVDLSNRTPGGRVRVARITGSAGTREISGRALAQIFGFTGTRIEYTFR